MEENNKSQQSDTALAGPSFVEQKPSHDRLFILKHSVGLISGWATAVLLTIMFGIVINDILTKKKEDSAFSVSAYLGSPYAFLIVSLLVFGAVYLLINWWKNSKKALPPTEKSEKVAHVLSTIFCVGLIVSTLGFLVSLLFPLIGKALGLADPTGRDIAKVVLTSLAGIIVTGSMAIYHSKIFKKLDWQIYTVALGGLMVIAMTLFILYPAAKARDPLHDQGVSSDLTKIAGAIYEATSKNNNKLPEDLKSLKIEDLKHGISSYKYTPKSSSSSDSYSYYSSRLTYELCAKFKTNTSNSYSGYGDDTVTSSYEFDYHNKGEHCFTVSASSWYSSSSRYNLYDSLNSATL